MIKTIINSAPQTAAITHFKGLLTATSATAVSPLSKLELTNGPRGPPLNNVSGEERQRRNRIVEEIIQTERSFKQSLERVTQDIVPFFKQQIQAGLVTQEEIKVIFGNVEVLVELSTRLLKELEDEMREPEQTRDVGRVFHQLAPFFKLFSEYCDEHPARIKMLQEVVGGREKVRQALEEIQRAKNLQSLNSYLIMPIQRVPRYVLLLEELTKKDQDETSKVRKALEAMRKVANHINESIRNRENAEKLWEIQNSIVDPTASLKTAIMRLAPRRGSTEVEGDELLFSQGRMFIRQGDFTISSNSTSPQTPSAGVSAPEARQSNRIVSFPKPQMVRRVYLFSDQLIHGMLYGKGTVLSPMRIIPSKVSIGNKEATFIVSSTTSTMIIFKCKDELEAKSWVADIEKVIERMAESKDRQQQSEAVTPVKKPSSSVTAKAPKQCQSCHRRFASNNASASVLPSFMKRSGSNIGDPFAGRCANCQRALCTSCCCGEQGTSNESRCAPCEVLRIAQQQTLTSLDDQEKRIVEELGKIQSHAITSRRMMLGAVGVLFFLLFYVAFLKPDAVFQGTIGLFLHGGGDGQGLVGRITFSSASSRFDWDFSEEATIATAKTLMLEEN